MLRHIRRILADCPSITSRLNGGTMQGHKPVYRFKAKGDNQEKYTDIGAAWNTNKEGVLSVKIRIGDQEISCIMVAAEERKPEAPAPRQPKQPGQQPVGAA